MNDMISKTKLKQAIVASSVAVMTGVSPGGAPATAAQASGGLTIHDAWIRNAIGAPTAGVFAVVENTTCENRAIVRASAGIADKAQLHGTKLTGTTMEMFPVKELVVPAESKVELKPGGFHVMLFGLRRPPAAGDTVALTLRFDDGSTATAMASVR